MKKAMLCAGVISAVTVANTNNGVSAATASSLSSLKHNVKQNQGGKERVLSGKKNEAAHSSAGDLQKQKSSSSEGDDVASLSFGGGKKTRATTTTTATTLRAAAVTASGRNEYSFGDEESAVTFLIRC